jgi:hypothetical protein
MTLFLNGVEGFIVVDMDLSVEVVVGNGGDRCNCIRGSGLRRHVWGRNRKASFFKDKMKNKSCFICENKKKRKSKIKFIFHYLLLFLRCPRLIRSNSIHHQLHYYSMLLMWGICPLVYGCYVLPFPADPLSSPPASSLSSISSLSLPYLIRLLVGHIWACQIPKAFEFAIGIAQNQQLVGANAPDKICLKRP